MQDKGWLLQILYLQRVPEIRKGGESGRKKRHRPKGEGKEDEGREGRGALRG
jgi:hypothetical protein